MKKSFISRLAILLSVLILVPALAACEYDFSNFGQLGESDSVETLDFTIGNIDSVFDSLTGVEIDTYFDSVEYSEQVSEHISDKPTVDSENIENETTKNQPDPIPQESEEQTTEKEEETELDISKLPASVGLEFVSNGDGTCSVSGIGSCKGSILVIPKVSPKGDKVVEIGKDAFHHNESIKVVVIPEGVHSIGNNAFNGCFYMEYAYLPDGLERIGDSAFYACWNLQRIVIPDSVTFVGQAAFSNCSGIKSVTFGVNVGYIGRHAVEFCYELKEVCYTGSSDEWSKIYVYGENNFLDTTDRRFLCTSKRDDSRLGSIEFISNGDGTCSVGGVGSFVGKELIIPDRSPAGDLVTKIEVAAFMFCGYIESVTIPESVEEIAALAFEDCEGLTTVHFMGTQEEWEQMGNSLFDREGIEVIFSENSEGEDTSSGSTESEETDEPSESEDTDPTETTEPEINDDTESDTTDVPTDTEPEETTVPEPIEKQYVREGEYIYFGEYPQTLKAASVTVSGVANANGYYLGSDGAYYAKVTAAPSKSGYTFSTGDAVTAGSTYYFKVEPIRWRVLSEDGKKAFLLCDSIIDCLAFDAGESNNYMTSDVRAWLNNQFCNAVFTELQQSVILTTTVDNSGASTGKDNNKYACADTLDKLFLLSVVEASSAEYGFSDVGSNDNAKMMCTSDYSRAMGALMSTDASLYGNGFWWLRSPSGIADYFSRSINYSGNGAAVDSPQYTGRGVVPALWIKL